ncbi:hypothetical protein DIPPA_21384 [Diplonema papillatum]|nr:hypothetical protein DIPPA_21384 [Diplonema papillatum]
MSRLPVVLAVCFLAMSADGKIEVTGVRTGFNLEFMRCDCCRVFVEQMLEAVQSSRPLKDGAAHRRRFFRDEVRADELMSQAVYKAVDGYHFVEYPDHQQRPGHMGTFVKYETLLDMNKHDAELSSAIRDEITTRDPGMLNFLLGMADDFEEAIHELVFEDNTAFDEWMDRLCTRATRFCSRKGRL